MEYIFNELKEEINIDKIGTLFYFEYDKDFKFQGEHHNFWEIVYCDRGEINIVAGDKNIMLRKGQIAFHKPGEFHSIMANREIAPNVMNISFKCNSTAMCYFENKIINISNEEKKLLIKIITEANTIFEPVIDESVAYLKPRKQQSFGGLQLIKIWLEMLLLQLIRRDLTTQNQKYFISKETTIVNNEALFNKIMLYLENNISRKITTNMICQDIPISRSSLQLLFRNNVKMGVMKYYAMMKMKIAKEMIRDGEYNLSQISEYLGFSSLHYFSRKFKIMNNMNPSEYSSSVKSKISI